MYVVGSAASHLITPEVKSTAGMIGQPELSFAGDMSKVARIEAIASQIVASARYLPGHELKAVEKSASLAAPVLTACRTQMRGLLDQVRWFYPENVEGEIPLAGSKFSPRVGWP